jgi:hypothetical protein
LAVGSIAALLAAALAGCDAPADGPEVATAQSQGANPPGAAASSAPAKVGDYDKALQYTRCMNENGEAVPDPVEGKPLPISAVHEGGFMATGPAFEKCRHLMPATWPVKADLALIAQHQAWGECMRKHGVDTPEMFPDANGMVHYQPDPILFHNDEWRAAEAACRSVDNPDSIPLTEDGQ